MWDEGEVQTWKEEMKRMERQRSIHYSGKRDLLDTSGLHEEGETGVLPHTHTHTSENDPPHLTLHHCTLAEHTPEVLEDARGSTNSSCELQITLPAVSCGVQDETHSSPCCSKRVTLLAASAWMEPGSPIPGPFWPSRSAHRK